MIVYRITSARFGADLTGMGAALYGGRWNNKGTSVIYTGESKEITLLETLIHTPPMLIPNLVMVEIQVPDTSLATIEIKDLPPNWKNYPAPSILAEIGENWIRSNSSLLLKVPSSIIDSAHLYVLNTQHSDFKDVKVTKIEHFHFDPRFKS